MTLTRDSIHPARHAATLRLRADTFTFGRTFPVYHPRPPATAGEGGGRG